jgi:hypothetical protein
MATPLQKTAAVSALVALITASIGGEHFLKKHPDPTLRETFAACEKGELSGIVCCEDMSKVTDWSQMMEQCLPVTPQNHDPGGFRAKEEDEWDAMNKAQQEEMK